MQVIKEWSFSTLLVLILVLAVCCWGCASKQHNSDNRYNSTHILSAKELHLGKEPRSVKREALNRLPEMTREEHETLGDIQFSRGDLGPAFVQYEKSLELNPDNSRIRYKKGSLLIIGGMNEDAILEFEKVLKKNPKHALSYEGLGMAYFQMKKYDDAEACFHKAIALDPKLWKAHNFLGIIYDYKNRSEKAVYQYEAAIALKDDNELLYNNLGISHFLAGDYQKAIKAFNKALATKRASSKTYNNLGLVLASAGKYREALEAFRKAGDEAQAHNNLGCAYLEQGKYKEAIRCFEKAIELRPTFYATASDNLRRGRLAYQSYLDSAEPNFRQSPTISNFEKLLRAKQLTMQANGSLSEKPAGWRGAKRGTIHTVSKGDSLAGISQQYYGSPGYWDIIYLENSKIIGNNPKNLKVGLKLVIP